MSQLGLVPVPISVTSSSGIGTNPKTFAAGAATSGGYPHALAANRRAFRDHAATQQFKPPAASTTDYRLS